MSPKTNPGIAEFLQRALESEGFSVKCAADGEAAQALALSGDYEMLLLDLMLPRRSGLEVLEAVRRERPELPVIVLTALGQKQDVVAGLDRGADDYITKPFDLDELLARVKAQLRKPAQRDPTRLVVGDIEMDLRTREVIRNGQKIRLTAREFELLAYLMRHPNQVLSRRADPQLGLGLRLRPRYQRPQRLHQLLAQKTHRRRGIGTD